MKDNKRVLLPKVGSLESILLAKMLEKPRGVTFMDFKGTGITEENIGKLVENLRTGMFEAENDHELKPDA